MANPQKNTCRLSIQFTIGQNHEYLFLAGLRVATSGRQRGTAMTNIISDWLTRRFSIACPHSIPEGVLADLLSRDRRSPCVLRKLPQALEMAGALSTSSVMKN